MNKAHRTRPRYTPEPAETEILLSEWYTAIEEGVGDD
jgi:hypothetical protein